MKDMVYISPRGKRVVLMITQTILKNLGHIGHKLADIVTTNITEY